MQDHASSPAESGTALPRVLGAPGDPTRLGTVRVLSGGEGITRPRQESTRCFVTLRRDSLDARFPGLRSALLSAAVAEHVGGHVTETRDED
ncbi:helix-turn-helix domain-containing protein [Streptomyces chlorus]|uniref:Transcriptional regulator n=1 Tax=Streptomyces chlorus TaxID=887452 RepID=A0ABW1DQJ4_9ACTN